MGLETIAIVGLATAVAGTLGSIGSTVMGMRQQKKAQKAQEQQQRLQAQQERRRMIRQQRIARAQTVNVGAQVGASGEGSSALPGGLTSLNSQTGAGLGFATQMQGLTDIANKANRKASMFGAIGSISSSIGSVGGSMFSAAGGFKAFEKPQTGGGVAGVPA